MPGVPARIGVQIQPQHADYADDPPAAARGRGASASTSSSTGTTSSRSTATPTARTSSAGRCSPPGPRPPSGSRSARWSPATPTATRNLLADMARTVDHIRQRRGGSSSASAPGWFERDYDEYGYEFGTAGGRLDALAHDLPRHQGPVVARSTRRRRATSRSSSAVAASGRRCGSSPSTRPSGTAFGNAETIAHKHEVLDEWCARVGRDPAEIVRSAGVAPTPGRMAEQVESYAGNAQSLVRRRHAAVHGRAVGSSGTTTSDKVRELVAWRDEVNR